MGAEPIGVVQESIPKLLENVVQFVKPKPKREHPRADNFVFKLHYKFTFAFLLVASILVSSYHFIDKEGSAIQCMMDSKELIEPETINKYCWISSTYTLPKYYEGKQGRDFLFYGVGPSYEDDEVVYHAYYQWVPMFLMFQACLFYAPHWLWMQMEGGRLKNIIAGLNIYMYDDDSKGDKMKKVKELAEYLHNRTQYRRDHRAYAIKYFICEFLNLVNVAAQAYLTNVFLGGVFVTYGIKVLKFHTIDPENRVDPMYEIFPRVTKCDFHKYGSSGTIQKFDALCVLGMNILNEKIYIFLWFWFLILAIITIINLFLRIIQYWCSNFRNRMFSCFEKRGHFTTKEQKKKIKKIVSDMTYSEWIVFNFVTQCLERRYVSPLLDEMLLLEDTPSHPLQKSFGDTETIIPMESEAKQPNGKCIH